MASVYLESTIPSYYMARMSRDIIIAAHQQLTQDWWESDRELYDLFVSEFVVTEISRGDPKAAEERLTAVEGIPVLRYDSKVQGIFDHLKEHLPIPQKAQADLWHIAYSVSYEIDYLLTWNCVHIDNAYTIQSLQRINTEMGWFTPLILTPQVLRRYNQE